MASVYDADADDFVSWSPLLWEPLGAELVDAVAPQPGERVLDACAGAGGSALLAARRVGGAGQVDAVDLTQQLVDRLAVAADQSGLRHLRTHVADVATWRTDEPYDVVVCGYGAFFLPELDRDGRHLVAQLRAGGRFAASTWDRGAMGFVGTVYEAVRSARPEVTAPVRSDRWLDSPDLLGGWLERIGLRRIEVRSVKHRVALSPQLAWAFVTGTGLRSLLTPLTEDSVSAVRQRLVELLDRQQGWELVADSLIGTGRLGDR